MKNKKQIAVIMGSKSDYETMRFACEILDQFAIGYEAKIVSAHRTPKLLYKFAGSASENGFKVIIAGAGGAAHLPGMVASLTNLPVLGVPIKSKNLNGLDSLLSIAQMPAGVPVGAMAIGKAGAKNAALLAVAILGLSDKKIATALENYRQKQTKIIEDEIL